MTTSKKLVALMVVTALAGGCGGTSTTGPTTPPISLGPEPDPHPASDAVSRAEALIAENHPAEAASLLEAEVAAHPDDPRAQLVLGIARTLLDDRAGAEPAFRRAIAIDPRYVEAHNELGLLLRDTERLPEAIVELALAVEIRPEFHDGWYNLALARDDADDLEGAEVAFARAVEGLSEDPIVRFHRAGLFLRMERNADAQRELLRARELAGSRTDILRAIARTFVRAGFVDDAAATIERAVRGAGQVSVDLYIEAAGIERSARRADKALDFARRATVVDTTSARAFAMLALVASDAGHADEARTALDRASALDTDGALREDLARLRARIDALH